MRNRTDLRARLGLALALTATTVAAVGCRDAAGPEPEPAAAPPTTGDLIPPPISDLLPPLTGDLRVTTVTTGSDLDPDGYTVTVDLLQSEPIATNGSVTFTGLLAGAHVVSLSGVAPNCTVSGANPRTVTVPAGGVASTTFSVSCTATTGDLTVTTATTGSDLDPDGYTVTVDGTTSQPIGVNSTVRFSGLAAGDHTAELTGVAGNCTVSGANPRTVTVPAGGVASTTFSVSCTATTGDLTVTTATTGSDLDPDGYTVRVDGTQSNAIATNGSVTFTGLAAGEHSVQLSDVAANCMVSGANPRTVTVPAGGVASTTFSVSCTAPPPPGGTRISGLGAIGPGTATPGSDRQEFDFDATDAPGGRLKFTDFSIVRPDGSVASLTADPAADPATGITAFTQTSAACVTFGGLGRVDTGELVDFTVDACDNGSPGVAVDFFGISVPAFAFSRSGTLSEGDITLSGGSPPPPTGTRVTGLGAIGPGTATPGSDRLEFDFEATNAPSGRAAVTDYSVVRPDGSVGRMTADPATDPATGVTSLERTSTACARFSGVGRLDTGELVQFFIDACDNASPGVGTDTFTITLPDRPFTRSGTLSEGDIVISTF